MARKQKSSFLNSDSNQQAPPAGISTGARGSQKTASISDSAPTEEQIAARAYELFIARGGEPGHSEEDWYQAERELLLGKH
jgi:hypothetical protein